MNAVRGRGARGSGGGFSRGRGGGQRGQRGGSRGGGGDAMSPRGIHSNFFFFYPVVQVAVPVQMGKTAAKSNKLGIFSTNV
jgi:hypothetical protein